MGDKAESKKMMAEAGFSLAYKAKPIVQSQAGGVLNQSNFAKLADLFNWR